jgi:hypothetical protein
MNHTLDVPGRLTIFGAPPTPATLEIEPLGIGRRVTRAAVVLLACWAAAVVAVFIPVAHLVLVPGLAVTGVVLAVLRLRQGERLVAVRGTCPRCQREHTFVVSGSMGRGSTVDCPGCLNRLVVTASAATPGVPGQGAS